MTTGAEETDSVVTTDENNENNENNEYNETILSLKTNLSSARLQLDALNSVDNEVKKAATILTENGNVCMDFSGNCLGANSV